MTDRPFSILGIQQIAVGGAESTTAQLLGRLCWGLVIEIPLSVNLRMWMKISVRWVPVTLRWKWI